MDNKGADPKSGEAEEASDYVDVKPTKTADSIQLKMDVTQPQKFQLADSHSSLAGSTTSRFLRNNRRWWLPAAIFLAVIVALVGWVTYMTVFNKMSHTELDEKTDVRIGAIKGKLDNHSKTFDVKKDTLKNLEDRLNAKLRRFEALEAKVNQHENELSGELATLRTTVQNNKNEQATSFLNVYRASMVDTWPIKFTTFTSTYVITRNGEDFRINVDTCSWTNCKQEESAMLGPSDDVTYSAVKGWVKAKDIHKTGVVVYLRLEGFSMVVKYKEGSGTPYTGTGMSGMKTDLNTLTSTVTNNQNKLNVDMAKVMSDISTLNSATNNNKDQVKENMDVVKTNITYLNEKVNVDLIQVTETANNNKDKLNGVNNVKDELTTLTTTVNNNNNRQNDNVNTLKSRVSNVYMNGMIDTWAVTYGSSSATYAITRNGANNNNNNNNNYQIYTESCSWGDGCDQADARTATLNPSDDTEYPAVDGWLKARPMHRPDVSLFMRYEGHVLTVNYKRDKTAASPGIGHNSEKRDMTTVKTAVENHNDQLTDLSSVKSDLATLTSTVEANNNKVNADMSKVHNDVTSMNKAINLHADSISDIPRVKTDVRTLMTSFNENKNKMEQEVTTMRTRFSNVYIKSMLDSWSVKYTDGSTATYGISRHTKDDHFEIRVQSCSWTRCKIEDTATLEPSKDSTYTSTEGWVQATPLHASNVIIYLRVEAFSMSVKYKSGSSAASTGSGFSSLKTDLTSLTTTVTVNQNKMKVDLQNNVESVVTLSATVESNNEKFNTNMMKMTDEITWLMTTVNYTTEKVNQNERMMMSNISWLLTTVYNNTDKLNDMLCNEDNCPSSHNKTCNNGRCVCDDTSKLVGDPINGTCIGIPRDGKWSEWTQWTECLCDIKSRTRECNNPTPVHGGADCVGVGNETLACTSTKPCPVDGGWSQWRNDTECSERCDGGERRISRECNNPSPKHGGLYCDGNAQETLACNTVPCPSACDYGYHRRTFNGFCQQNGQFFKTELKLKNMVFTQELNNTNSTQFKRLAIEVEEAIFKPLQIADPWIVSVDVYGFRKGSVIAQYYIVYSPSMRGVKDARSVERTKDNVFASGNVTNIEFDQSFTSPVILTAAPTTQRPTTTRAPTTKPCVRTSGGDANGACCHFPFTADGMQWNSCKGSGANAWCWTTPDSSSSPKWGYCI